VDKNVAQQKYICYLLVMLVDMSRIYVPRTNLYFGACTYFGKQIMRVLVVYEYPTVRTICLTRAAHCIICELRK